MQYQEMYVPSSADITTERDALLLVQTELNTQVKEITAKRDDWESKARAMASETESLIAHYETQSDKAKERANQALNDMERSRPQPVNVTVRSTYEPTAAPDNSRRKDEIKLAQGRLERQIKDADRKMGEYENAAGQSKIKKSGNDLARKRNQVRAYIESIRRQQEKLEMEYRSL
tara:strand:+ start:493 stop:1017 length:525 start_codon:yes stop_codon:yes gene_type:complete